jgi:hypothetical protein
VDLYFQESGLLDVLLPDAARRPMETTRVEERTGGGERRVDVTYLADSQSKGHDFDQACSTQPEKHMWGELERRKAARL